MILDMSLGRRLMVLIVTLGAGLTLIVATAAWGVARLNQNLAAALGEYDQLRVLYDLGLELTRISEMGDGDTSVAASRVQLQREGLALVADADLRLRLGEALSDPRGPGVQVSLGLNRVMGAITATKGRIRELDADARRHRRTTLVVMAGLGVLTLTGVGLTVRGQLRALDRQVRAKGAALAQAERLASVGFLAAGVAHEINNPLGIIAGEAELAGRRAADEPTRKAMRVIVEEAARTKAITGKLLALASPQRTEPVALQWTTVADDMLATIARMDRFAGRLVDVAVIRPGTVRGDRTLLGQVVLNLAVNALDATAPTEGRVRIEVDGARLSVVDDGPGLRADEIARVFEPFYRSGATSPNAGHGLGLSISQAIVRHLGGELTATSRGPGQGCRFSVELPEVQA